MESKCHVGFWSIVSCLIIVAITSLGCELNEVDDTEDTASESFDLVNGKCSPDSIIANGRGRLGTYGGQCKEYVRNVVSSACGVNIPSTSSQNYRWTDDSTPATVVARWIGSYANGRVSLPTLSANAVSAARTIVVPNADPQLLVLYASTAKITATLTKGATRLSVTSTGTLGGTVSSSNASGAGNWVLTLTNTGTTAANSIVAVVLSKSRFQSDWETARPGDMMQMYGGTSQFNRSLAHPHTVIVQTERNAVGTCANADTIGCNWLDSNWASPEDGRVRAHGISMNAMMLMMAFSPSYGFSVYRLN